MCVSSCAGLQSASNRCTRSPDDTTVTPRLRTASTVPASTRAIYGMALSGEYSIASVPTPLSSASSSSRQRLAARVLPRVARQVREGVRFDGVNQRARRALGRDQVEPPARRHLAAAVEPGQATRDGIAAVKVVEQPAVEAVLGKGRLHVFQSKRHESQYTLGFRSRSGRRLGPAARLGTNRPPNRAAASENVERQ